jgi:hypothetical protein
VNTMCYWGGKRLSRAKRDILEHINIAVMVFHILRGNKDQVLNTVSVNQSSG